MKRVKLNINQTSSDKSQPNLKYGLSRRQFLVGGSAAFLSTSALSALAHVIALSSQPLESASLSWGGYKNAIVIDGLSGAFRATTNNIDTKQLEIIRASGITAVNMTVPYPGDNFEQANIKIKNTLKTIEHYSKYFRLIRSPQDILLAKKSQQIGIIIGFQSTEMFGTNLANIDYFANAGSRIMQMSYNGQSQYGDGGLVKENKGLSKLGIEALERMQNNHVLVDLSHSGQRTVADAIRYSKAPIALSHTGCNAIYQHPRNNDDRELKALADKGGVVGIYLMPFLEGGDGEITAKSFMNHLSHAINTCGEDHVSIGSDQGIVPVNDTLEYRESVRKDVERRIAAGISAPGETPNRPPFIPQLNSERRMELIAACMQRAGYSEQIIEKVIGKNLYRLFSEVWK